MYALMVLVFILSLWTLYYTSDHDQMVFDPWLIYNIRISGWFGSLDLILMVWRAAFTQKMTNSQLWYWRHKQANKTNAHHKPPATKTITSKSIWTASNYFNDAINNHFPQDGNIPIVLSFYFSERKEGENEVSSKPEWLFKRRYETSPELWCGPNKRTRGRTPTKEEVMWEFTAHTGLLPAVDWRATIVFSVLDGR